MTKRALITGVTGQDGSYMAQQLLDKGYEVHGLVRRSSTFNRGRIDHLHHDEHLPGKNLHLHYGDVTDAARKAKRARQEAATIELDDEPMDEAEMGLFGGENAPPQSGAAGSSGVVKVKPEVKAEGGNSGKAKAEWA